MKKDVGSANLEAFGDSTVDKLVIVPLFRTIKTNSWNFGSPTNEVFIDRNDSKKVTPSTK